MGKKQQQKSAKQTEPQERADSPARSRRTVVVLLAILAVGLVLRAGYLVELTGLPDFDQPLVEKDTGAHEVVGRLATDLFGGDGLECFFQHAGLLG